MKRVCSVKYARHGKTNRAQFLLSEVLERSRLLIETESRRVVARGPEGRGLGMEFQRCKVKRILEVGCIKM